MVALNVGTMHKPLLIRIPGWMQLSGLKISMLTSVQRKINHRTKSSPRIQDAWWASVHRVQSYLNGVVAEIRWAERLSFVPHDIGGSSSLAS